MNFGVDLVGRLFPAYTQPPFGKLQATYLNLLHPHRREVLVGYGCLPDRGYMDFGILIGQVPCDTYPPAQPSPATETQPYVDYSDRQSSLDWVGIIAE